MMNKACNCFRGLLLVSLIAVFGMVGAQEKELRVQTAEGELLIPLDGSLPMKVLSDGNVEATAVDTFSCQQDGCDDVQVSMADADGAFLSVSPSTVTLGSSFRVDWRSRGAWECQGSGLSGTTWNTSNPKLPFGSQSVDSSNLDLGDLTLELSCSNGPNEAARSVVITVAEDSTEDPDPAPEECSNVPQLSEFGSWSKATDVIWGPENPNPDLFSEVFKSSFPGSGNTRNFYLPKNRYAAMAFTTPSDLNSGHSGNFLGENPGFGSSQVAKGPTLYAVSRCPGDFDVNQGMIEDPNCVFHGTESFKWQGPNGGSFWDCELQAGTTYYMNVLFSVDDSFPPTQARCSDASNCGVALRSSSTY